MERFKELYRIDTARAKWWDYSLNASYFVTIITSNRHNYFGDIVNKKMIRSELGEIAYRNWLKIPEFHLIAFLDEFIVMPNHIHGIITINKNNVERGLQLFESPLNNHQNKGKNFFGP